MRKQICRLASYQAYASASEDEPLSNCEQPPCARGRSCAGHGQRPYGPVSAGWRNSNPVRQSREKGRRGERRGVFVQSHWKKLQAISHKTGVPVAVLVRKIIAQWRSKRKTV